MLIKRPERVRPSEITPPQVYRARRRFLQGLAGGALAGLGVDAAAGEPLVGVRRGVVTTGEKPTPYADVTRYNNFYEFGSGKNDPAKHGKDLRTRPWTIAVEGRCVAPRPTSSRIS